MTCLFVVSEHFHLVWWMQKKGERCKVVLRKMKRPKESNMGVVQDFFWPVRYNQECLPSEWIFSVDSMFLDNWNRTFSHHEKKKRIEPYHSIGRFGSICFRAPLLKTTNRENKSKTKYLRQKLKCFLTRRLQLCCKNSVNINDDNKPARHKRFGKL